MSVDLSRAEERAIGRSVDLWNAVLDLPIEHPDDRDEIRRSIHAIQALILCRPARRRLNEGEPA